MSAGLYGNRKLADVDFCFYFIFMNMARKKITNDQFIKKAKNIHGDQYDYSLVEYTGSSKKVKIICPKHGVFEQVSNNHVSLKQGCPKCAGNHKLNSNSFKNKANKIHGNIYDYSLVDYKSNKSKVKIICPIHGIFEQKPNDHISQKQGCPKCAGVGFNTEDFVNECSDVHNDKYDYSLFEYKSHDTESIIICPIHGEFKQKPFIHKRGNGCPTCSESKGEKKVARALKSLNIPFERQKTFNDCVNPKTGRKLKFDFFFTFNKKEYIIEYDGEYHFQPWRLYWDKEKSNQNFKELQFRDELKNSYMKKFTSLRIPYTKLNLIDEEVRKFLNY